MNTIKILLLFTISTLLINCSSNDDESTNEPENSFALVKSIDDGFKINYRYSNGLLTNVSGIDTNKLLDINYVYNESGDIVNESSSETSGNESFNLDVNYTYNSGGLLSSYSTSQGLNASLNYSGNDVAIDFNGTTQIQLQLDSNGKVTQLSTANFYKIFTYDNNKNLILNEEFDYNNVLQKKHEYNYDQNTNPFFMQLESIYLEKFIGFFGGSGVSFSDSFYFDFPYLKNNLVSSSFNEGSPDEFTFELNLDGNPISVSELQSDGVTNNYIIEY